MNHTRISNILTVLFAVVLCLGPVGLAEPMGTAFTYQGRLLDANSVADGLYDFQFKLFEAASDGNQMGADVNKPEVDVIDGYFTVGLDFGSGVFDGDARWLQIGVRPGDQNDPFVYSLLSPRQKVTPTPYALYAKTAGSGGGSPWEVNDTIIYYNHGNVGIGTANPKGMLQVGEPFIVTGADTLYPGDKGEDCGISDSPTQPAPEITPDAKLEIATGTTKDFLMISSNRDGDGDLVIVKNNGYVGIGTTTPDYELDVQGKVRFGNESSRNILFENSDIYSLDNGAQTTLELQSIWQSSNQYGETIINRFGGNVGIGTGTPAAKLEINNGTSCTSGLRFTQLTSACTPGAAGEKVLSVNANGDVILVGDNTGTGGADDDWTGAGTGSMYATYVSDNVTIGGTTPATKLTVYGDLTMGSGVNNTKVIFKEVSSQMFSLFYENAGSSPFNLLHIRHENSSGMGVGNIMTFTQSGNVGIGTGTPAAKLEINNGTSCTSGLRFTQLTSACTPGAAGEKVLSVNANGDVILVGDNTGTGGADDDWAAVGVGPPTLAGGIYHTGEVGIGIATPDRLLHVDGTASEGIAAFTYGAPGINESAVKIGTAWNTRNGLSIKTSNNNASDFVHASLWIENVGDGGLTFYAADSASDVTPFVIENDGDVGIGTNSPTAKLDVNGATGYNQLRMRTSYTPTGTGDTNGNVGDIAWDPNYVYVKTGEGWKRTQLSTF